LANAVNIPHIFFASSQSVQMGAPPVNQQSLSRLATMEGWHFWFAGRRMLLGRLLSSSSMSTTDLVLDLGCGTGRTLQTLRSCGYRVVGLDLQGEGLRAARRSCGGCALVQADATRIPFASSSFDAVLLLDIAEHVDDRALLTEVSRVLRPRGVAIVAVPAMQWLWSYRDEAAGHLRRYSKAQLTRALEAADLRVREIRYYQFFLFPFIAATRLLGRHGPRMRDAEDRPHHSINAVLSSVNRTEAWLSDFIQWPWGSSLAAVCRKE
jgi:SAM-dependent methyltransferase